MGERKEERKGEKAGWVGEVRCLRQEIGRNPRRGRGKKAVKAVGWVGAQSVKNEKRHHVVVGWRQRSTGAGKEGRVGRVEGNPVR